jgi:hypothetical protein
MAEPYPTGIRAAALAVRCPRCESAPRVPCVDRAGRFIPALHSGRKSLAVGEGAAIAGRIGPRHRAPGRVTRAPRLDEGEKAA